MVRRWNNMEFIRFRFHGAHVRADYRVSILPQILRGITPCRTTNSGDQYPLLSACFH